MLRPILTATIFSATATLSGAQDIDANDLIGLASETTSQTKTETVNAGAGPLAFEDLVRSAGLDAATLGSTLGQSGDPLRNGGGLAPIFCGLHKRFEMRIDAPSFASGNTKRRKSFDPLALN